MGVKPVAKPVSMNPCAINFLHLALGEKMIKERKKILVLCKNNQAAGGHIQTVSDKNLLLEVIREVHLQIFKAVIDTGMNGESCGLIYHYKIAILMENPLFPLKGIGWKASRFGMNADVIPFVHPNHAALAPSFDVNAA